MYNPLHIAPSYKESITSTDFFAFLDYYFWGDDYDDDCGFSPYAGLQLGKSFYNQSQEYMGQTYNYDRNTLAWDIHVGTDYKIAKNIKLNLQIDYMNYNYPTPETFFNVGIGGRYSF
jgi:opacity protein-like surface antigen